MTTDSTVDFMAVASRRAVLAGAGAAAIAVLGGCATYDQTAPVDGGGGDAEAEAGNQPSAAASASGASSTDASTPPADAPPAGAPPAPVLASTSDIPVSGGKVFEQRGVVVTQPQAGTFKAFSAVCTHAGCIVAEVKNGTINCPCHGSRFAAADGSVANGPASRPLKPVRISVTGNDIHLL
jgi:Rieske Fe-S protein